MSCDKPDTLTKASLGGSIVAAVSASLCCLGPIIAVSIGASGFAAASAFARWRPLFLVLTFALLGLAWFLSYSKPKTSPEDSSACPATPASRWNKLVLFLATAVVLLFAVFPYLSSAALRLRSNPGQQSNVTDRVVLKVCIPSMDCAACAATQKKPSFTSTRTGFRVTSSFTPLTTPGSKPNHWKNKNHEKQILDLNCVWVLPCISRVCTGQAPR